jgi:hypothetical protein
LTDDLVVKELTIKPKVLFPGSTRSDLYLTALRLNDAVKAHNILVERVFDIESKIDLIIKKLGIEIEG